MVSRALLIIALTLTFAACSYQSMIDLMVSEEEVEFAETFIENLREGNLYLVRDDLDSILAAEVTIQQMAEVAAYFPSGDPVSIEVAGAFLHYEGGQEQVSLTLEYKFTHGWAVVSLVIDRTKGKPQIAAFHVLQTESSLKATHEFGLAGKAMRHYVMLGAAVIVPVFILVSLITCIRTPIDKRKWLWCLFTMLGFVTTRINWHTGEGTIQPISFQLFGVGFTSHGPYAPWIIGVSLPVGAIAFWIFRRRLAGNSNELPEAPSDQPSQQPPEGPTGNNNLNL